MKSYPLSAAKIPRDWTGADGVGVVLMMLCCAVLIDLID